MLPITRETICSKVNQKGPFRDELLIIQHMREDTLEFLKILVEHRFNIVKVLAIPYSLKPETLDRARGLGLDVAVLSVSGRESNASVYLKEAFGKAASSGRRVLIHEVGGYCARPLHHELAEFLPSCAGVVEETTYGKRQYEAISPLRLPVLQVADSKLKSLEARAVGNAVAGAVSRMLHGIGISLFGRFVLVLGYGPIGQSVAVSLRAHNTVVGVFDTDPIRMAQAMTEGIIVGEREKLLGKAEIVVGASGYCSVDSSDLDLLQDRVVLASASSRDIEFNLPAFRDLASSVTVLGASVEQFENASGKSYYILNKGFPVNFSQEKIGRAHV